MQPTFLGCSALGHPDDVYLRYFMNIAMSELWQIMANDQLSGEAGEVSEYENCRRLWRMSPL
jgi:hypothetical protein